LHRLDVYLRPRADSGGHTKNEERGKGRCGILEQIRAIARTRSGDAARAASLVRMRFGDVAAGGPVSQ